jgi:two-component system, chemotaxis family, chemotaxis protein CheY
MMKNVLLVDDSRAIRLVGRRIIEALGHAVLEAENGAEALQVCRSRSDIDAILLDWNMPVMNGLEFLTALRGAPGPQPIVVMCTTENDLQHISAALSAGANEYVMKPFTEEILRGKLEEAGVTA